MHPDSPVSAYLPLRYVLTDTLAVRTILDPLHVESDHLITGRAQRGMLAAALLRAGRDRQLHAWVARGDRLRFAPAHPRLEPGADSRHRKVGVALPPPAHLYTPGKHADTTVDVFGPTDPTVPYKAVREPLTPDRASRVVPRTTTERYLGPPHTGTHGRGVPFFATTLDPGQVFEARWQLLGDNEEELRELAEQILEVLAEAEGTLTLGSGGTRAHGGVRVEPVDPEHPLSPDRISGAGSNRSVPAGEPVDLLLLSPALIVGAHGGERPQALVSSVLDLVDRRLPDLDVAVVTAHVEAELVGAYHRGYQGPMAQRWAARPGAVVRLRPDRALTTAQVRDLEAHPVGERVTDGYGQFTLLPPPGSSEPLAPILTPSAGHEPGTVTLADGRPVAGHTFGTDRADPQVRELYDTLLWNAAAQPVRDHALALVDRSTPLLAPLTPGLLGRLRDVMIRPHRTPLETLESLRKVVSGDVPADETEEEGTPLRGRPRRALERARLVSPGPSRTITVRTWLEGPTVQGPAHWWQEHRPGPDYLEAIAVVDLSLSDGRPPTHPDGLSEEARDWERRTAERLCLLLVSAWLAEAARTLRTTSLDEGTGP